MHNISVSYDDVHFMLVVDEKSLTESLTAFEKYNQLWRDTGERRLYDFAASVAEDVGIGINDISIILVCHEDEIRVYYLKYKTLWVSKEVVPKEVVL